MSNTELKQKIKDSGLYQWQVAAAIGITEMTLIRWLRLPLSNEHYNKIVQAIETLKAGAANE